MKSLTFILLAAIITLISCKKEDKITLSTCNESPPANEPCMMLIHRWFYNKKSTTCEEITYGGCSRKGFETKEACEKCICNK